MKKCTKCGENKKSEEFGKDKRLKSGLKSFCKSCHYKMTLNWRKQNPNAVKKTRKKHYETHKHLWQEREANMSEEEREKKRASTRLYYELHRDEINAKSRERYKNLSEEEKRKYSQKYYDQNKEHLCAQQREYYKNLSEECKKRKVEAVKVFRQKNREKMRAWSAIGNAVLRGDIEKPLYCSSCDAQEKLHAHHEDYSKPLEVEWLCHKCHMKVHADKRRVNMNEKID